MAKGTVRSECSLASHSLQSSLRLLERRACDRSTSSSSRPTRGSTKRSCSSKFLSPSGLSLREGVRLAGNTRVSRSRCSLSLSCGLDLSLGVYGRPRLGMSM